MPIGIQNNSWPVADWDKIAFCYSSFLGKRELTMISASIDSMSSFHFSLTTFSLSSLQFLLSVALFSTLVGLF